MTVKKLHIFDLDGTLLTGNASFLFTRHLGRMGFVPNFSIFRAVKVYALHSLLKRSIIDLHNRVFDAIVKGLSLVNVEKQALRFVNTIVPDLLNGSVIRALEEAKKRGEYIAIFSGSPSFLVGPIAKLLGVERFKSSNYLAGKEGNFDKIDFLVDGHEKAKLTKELADQLGVSMGDVFAYSDSYYDLPLLESVGTPVIVNPDRRLKNLSKARDWLIL